MSELVAVLGFDKRVDSHDLDWNQDQKDSLGRRSDSRFGEPTITEPVIGHPAREETRDQGASVEGFEGRRLDASTPGGTRKSLPV